MTKPIVKIHNQETDEIIEREMNDAEYAQYQADQADAQARKAEEQVKASKRAELLDRLGISEEEARLLLS